MRGCVESGERKRDSESMWRVKGDGRYVKDEERGKGRPILHEEAIDRTVFLHSVDTQTW